MARIGIILEDDEGNEIPGERERVYELGQRLDRLREIEAAVQQFKDAALPDLEAELLERAQARAVKDAKKETASSATGDGR